MASAMAVTEAETEHLEPQNGLKRRQSSVSEQESKRPRISSGKNSPSVPSSEVNRDAADSQTAASAVPTADDTGPGGQTRRRSSVADEKQRSKRLFGALLGNLNQGSASDRASKRRQEIEDRRKAELRRQDDERLEDKQRRLEQLAEHRKKEQRDVDEHNLRIRHSSMLDTANFLQTKAEPRLYFRPWDLRPDEEDQIEEQINEARAKIESENASFKQFRRSQQEESADMHTDEAHNDDTVMVTVGNTEHQGNGDSAAAKARAESTDSPETSKSTATSGKAIISNTAVPFETTSKPRDPEEVVDDDGDHVVEGDEDTVIY